MGFESTSGLGTFNHYGARPISDRPGKIALDGAIEQVKLKITGAELASAAVFADLAGAATIPAGAYIKSATLQVTTAFVGGTNVDVGLYYNNSGAIATLDADGVMDAVLTATLIANAVVDTVAAGAGGNLVATTSLVTTADEYALVAIAAGTYTSGEAELTVEYILPAASV
jgi:hypothetical protein